MGKGGVGKTTVSVSIGLAAARLGKKVLLVETGKADTIAPFFRMNSLSNIPVVVHENVWAVRVDPRRELDEYVQAHVGSSFIAKQITNSKLYDHLAEATPGIKEVMTLGRIWRWEQSKEKNGTLTFDMIVIDSPATGHGLSLLRLPQTVTEMVRVGPIFSQTKMILDMLQNQALTWLTVVTLPEELPVNEAMQFNTISSNELNMPVQLFFLNGVYPPDAFTPEQATDILSRFEEGKKLGRSDRSQMVLDSARRLIIRRQLQETYIEQMKNLNHSRLIEIPFYFINRLTVTEALDIATLLINKLNHSE